MAIEINGDTGISGVNGSATTPAIQGTDTNTGLSFGTDEVNIVTGGTTRATVDSNGRLLVGTTTARAADFVTGALQIEGTNQNTSSIQLTCNSATSAGTAAELNFSRSLGSAVGDTDAATSGDNLGIINFTGADGTDLNSVAAQIRGIVDADTGSNDMPGRLAFYTTADGASSPTERVRITQTGVVHISNTGSGPGTNPSNRIFYGTAGNDAVLIENSASDPYTININHTTATNNSSNYFFLGRDNNAQRFGLRTNGGLHNYQSNDSNLCDEREKKNIVDLDSTWDCLKNWELKKFHYNEDADNADLRYGVIAQQVATHCPEVITDWVKQKAAEAELDEDGNVITPAQEEILRMGVKEQQMYWMAIRALQEAQTRIEQLETRVAQLEGGTN